jgi:hypothetical protein
MITRAQLISALTGFLACEAANLLARTHKRKTAGFASGGPSTELYSDQYGQALSDI